MKTKITDEVARLEAENTELAAKLEHERRRNDMQAGALRESRATNADLIEKLSKMAESNAQLREHFYIVHGTSKRIDEHVKSLADAPGSSGTAESLSGASEQPTSLRSRLRGLRAAVKTEAA